MILGFIGIKLVIEALHGSHIDHLGAIPLPEIGIATSLLFILATLTITVGASLAKTRLDARRSLTWLAVGQAGGRRLFGRAATAAS